MVLLVVGSRNFHVKLECPKNVRSTTSDNFQKAAFFEPKSTAIQNLLLIVQSIVPPHIVRQTCPRYTILTTPDKRNAGLLAAEKVLLGKTNQLHVRRCSFASQ
jgi:hypothetical protein